MDRIHDIEVFLAIVEAGSLAGAGRRLALSAPAVTRALSRLEDRLGEALVLRSTRSFALTPAGEVYAHRARDVLDALEHADAAVAERRRALRGTLTVTAPLMFGRLHVAPALADFLAHHPDVSGKLVLFDRLAHFVDEGIDIGVRIGHLRDSTLVVRRIGDVRQVVVASPDYLAERGQPASPGDLQGHRLIAFTGRLSGGRLVMRDGLSVPFEPVHIQVDCAATAVSLAEAGVGITVLWSYQCADAVAAGRLCLLFEEVAPAAAPVHFIWPERRYENSLMRAFVTHAVPLIGARLTLGTGLVGPPSVGSPSAEPPSSGPVSPDRMSAP